MPSFDPTTLDWLLTMMYNINPYVEVFKMERDMMATEGVPMDLKLHLIASRTKDARRYNVPMVNDVVALMVGDGFEALDKRDIVVAQQASPFQRMWGTWLYIIHCYFLTVRMGGIRIFRSMVLFCKILMQIWMKTMWKNMRIIESIAM